MLAVRKTDAAPPGLDVCLGLVLQRCRADGAEAGNPENSPAIHGWVAGARPPSSPAQDGRSLPTAKLLPSRTGLGETGGKPNPTFKRRAIFRMLTQAETVALLKQI